VSCTLSLFLLISLSLLPLLFFSVLHSFYSFLSFSKQQQQRETSPFPSTRNPKTQIQKSLYLSVYTNLLTFQLSKCLCVPLTHRGWIHPSLSLWTGIGDWTGRLPLVINLALVLIIQYWTAPTTPLTLHTHLADARYYFSYPFD